MTKSSGRMVKEGKCQEEEGWVQFSEEAMLYSRRKPMVKRGKMEGITEECQGIGKIKRS